MNLPDHLFVSSFEGDLYDTRQDNWSNSAPLRRNYCGHNVYIQSVAELKATLRAGHHTNIGGYPLYFVTNDGCALSYDSVRDNFRQVCSAIQNNSEDGWRVIGSAINYEDNDLCCEHSGEPISAAYGDDEDSSDESE